MYSVIDIGSNTIRLAVYRVDGEGITPILNNKYTAGLAAYVGKDGSMAPEGIERLVDVMGKFRAALDLLPDCRCFPFATASLRNITNRDEVVERVREATGFEIRVLSGYEEAMLDYRGAVRSLPGEQGLLVDVGGGSTELVFFKAGRGRGGPQCAPGLAEPVQQVRLRHHPHGRRALRHEERGPQGPGRGLPDAQGFSAQPMCGVGGTARGALALYRGMEGEPGPEGYETQFFSRVPAPGPGQSQKADPAHP